MEKSKVSSSIGWKLLERFGFHGIKMLIQIILARLLLPADYDIIGILLVFVDLFVVLVQSGLNTALIQKKDADKTDYSSIFWVNTALSVILYGVLFFSAPYIAAFYSNEAITKYLRVISLTLFAGSYNSIQIAYASKSYNYKSQFIANSVSVVLSGATGIILAINGAGVWALIAQQLLWQYINCLLMQLLVKWKPSFVFDIKRVKKLVRFGIKVLFSSLMMRMNSMITNLVIGKKFSEGELAYYSKAQNFPAAFSDVVVASITSVALVNISEIQDEKTSVYKRLRQYIQNSYFFVAPAMIGLACVAKPFVMVLLTEKWLPCVPILQVTCALYLFQPLYAIYGQAVSGVGRSDLFLRALLIARPIGLTAMFITVSFTDKIIYVAWIVVITAVIEAVIQVFTVRRLLGYPLRKQIADCFIPILAACIMAIPVYAINYLKIAYLPMILIQVIVGALAYTAVITLFRHPMVKSILNRMKKIKK